MSSRVDVSPPVHDHLDLYHLVVATCSDAPGTKLTRIWRCVVISIVTFLAFTVAKLLAVAFGQAVSARIAVE